MSSRISNSLNGLLADFAVFYQKLRNYHWNVTGSRFFVLHEKFEELYNDVALDIDEIAERIRSLDERPASTMEEFLKISSINEDKTVPTDSEMIQNIMNDMMKLTSSMRALVDEADEIDDPATVNMLEDIADKQEKQSWMLRSWINQENQSSHKGGLKAVN